ncbi:hypothetical protein BKA58DRAFT_51944 [Alternaria rosae]|uniref:uncharacterized protein n=1 Tax=Alternaria rosae TaxID=1187941 RepID=UPI001E8D4D9D|nr:uncharacterized protein BKA58DRAFT_51944 [Alternaria rosae]KAH6859015.1 hypothetical protein BKA58DRAFT_51944 [Alternaria rosae]
MSHNIDPHLSSSLAQHNSPMQALKASPPHPSRRATKDSTAKAWFEPGTCTVSCMAGGCLVLVGRRERMGVRCKVPMQERTGLWRAWALAFAMIYFCGGWDAGCRYGRDDIMLEQDLSACSDSRYDDEAELGTPGPGPYSSTIRVILHRQTFELLLPKTGSPPKRFFFLSFVRCRRRKPTVKYTRIDACERPQS